MALSCCSTYSSSWHKFNGQFQVSTSDFSFQPSKRYTSIILSNVLASYIFHSIVCKLKECSIYHQLQRNSYEVLSELFFFCLTDVIWMKQTQKLFSNQGKKRGQIICLLYKFDLLGSFASSIFVQSLHARSLMLHRGPASAFLNQFCLFL